MQAMQLFIAKTKAESVIPAYGWSEPVYDEDQALQVPLLAQLKLPKNTSIIKSKSDHTAGWKGLQKKI